MRIVTGRSPETGQSIAVGIDEGVIVSIGPAPHAETAWLSAGFIDLQVNGYAGLDLNGPEVGETTIHDLADAMLGVGVTRFVPTLITESKTALTRSLRVLAAARQASPKLTAMIPYVHLEGPYISPNDGPRGAHALGHVRAWDIAEIAELQQASGNLLGMITLSPHNVAAMPFIAAVTKQGIHVAIGHSDASPELIHTAAVAGAVLSTHLGNGVASLLPRHNNLIWAQLADDRLTATFIADGHHLPADTFKAMVRAKGISRSILVSDSVSLAGMPAGVYDTPVGGQVELSDDGRLGLKGTPYLAGAALPLKDGIARAVRDAGVSLAEAITMATANPGRFIGGGGNLRIGGRADLVRFFWQDGDDHLKIDACWLGGERHS